MDDIAARKAQAREAAFARRKQAHRPGQDCTAHLRARLEGRAGRIIAGYLPIRTEIDPLPAMTALAPGDRICVPRVRGPGQPLEFLEWWPGCPLEAGAFGVRLPVGTRVLVPDTLIVPLVAFTPACFRLGYGGGFYDRTLAGLRDAGGPVRALGFAYAAQQVADLPLEPTDMALDAVVTETGVVLP